MLRLRVVEYFEELRNALDLYTETKISGDVELEDYLNSRRDKQLEAIKKIEQASLARADKVLSTTRRDSIEEKESEEQTLAKVLTEYCFPLEYGGMMFVATVDKYIDEKTVDMLRKFLTFDHKDLRLWSYKEKSDFIGCQVEAFNNASIEFKSNWYKHCHNILRVDETVVDMSWWFSLEYHFDEIEINTVHIQPDF